MSVPKNQPSAIVADPARLQAKPFGSDALGVVVLSGVAGYVDTAGCLTLFGMLTAHVTGSLVTAGSLVGEHPKMGAMARLSMLPIFMITVALTALFVRRRKRRGASTLVPLLALMTTALLLFCVTGAFLQRFAMTPDAWAVGLIGATGVVAMAIQNTLMRDSLSGYTPTTIMTGNLTQVTIDLVELVLPSPHLDDGLRTRMRVESRARLVRFGLPLAGFMTGAASGAALTHALGLLSIAVPTGATFALTVVAWYTGPGRTRALPRTAPFPAAKEPLADVVKPGDGAAVGATVTRLHPAVLRATAHLAAPVAESASPLRSDRQSGTHRRVAPIGEEELPPSSRHRGPRRSANL